MTDAKVYTYDTASDPAGVCTVCGAPAYHHKAKKCEEHRDQTKRASTRTTPNASDTDMRIHRPDPVGDRKITSPGDAAKVARALELEKSILVDLNPVLLQGFAMLARPIEAGNFYRTEGATLIVTELGQQVILSQGEAKILGKAAAELERSPIGTMATAAMGPLMPVAYGIAALGVVGFHAWKMAGLRAALLTQYNAQVQTQNGTMAGAAAVPSDGEGVPADVRGFGSTKANGGAPDLDFQTL